MAQPNWLDAFDWNWWGRYGPEVQLELLQIISAFIMREYPDMAPNEVQRLAAKWAEERAGQLLRIDGPENLAALTRQRVGELVGEALENGDSLSTLRKRLQEDLAFSRQRATMVARTETAMALGEGAKEAARAQGRNEKAWVTQSDGQVDEDCLANEAAGWIGIDDAFPTGHMQIPAHPDCRCNTRYRTAELHAGASVTRLAEFRDARGHLLDKDVPVGEKRYCRKCKEEVIARA